MVLEIKDFKQVNYRQFARVLKDAYDETKNPVDKIMTKTNRKGMGTIFNILNPNKQKVPDQVLEKAALALGLKCVIAIHGGNRLYFIYNTSNDETTASAN